MRVGACHGLAVFGRKARVLWESSGKSSERSLGLFSMFASLQQAAGPHLDPILELVVNDDEAKSKVESLRTS